MVDQCTWCQHAGPILNHTGWSQGTRPPGKVGSDAAQISQFLWEGAELAPCSPLSSPLPRGALGSGEVPHPASLPATLPSLPCPQSSSAPSSLPSDSNPPSVTSTHSSTSHASKSLNAPQCFSNAAAQEQLGLVQKGTNKSKHPRQESCEQLHSQKVGEEIHKSSSTFSLLVLLQICLSQKSNALSSAQQHQPRCKMALNFLSVQRIFQYQGADLEKYMGC